jgi:hypothetical protein
MFGSCTDRVQCKDGIGNYKDMERAMKMTSILVGVLLIIGSFLGGQEWSDYKHSKLPAKTIVHDTKIEVDSKTTSKAEANAYAVTILKDGQMFKTLVISSAGTNIEVSVTSNKKESWKTNISKTN